MRRIILFLLIILTLALTFLAYRSFSDYTSLHELSTEQQQLLWSFSQSARITTSPHFTKSQLALAQLGRQLFFDPRFSRNSQIACATCHIPERAFTDGRPRAHGLAPAQRNTPSVINTFLNQWFFWDGRTDSLEAQALKPIEAQAEHGFTRLEAAITFLQYYKSEYKEVFGAPPAAIQNLAIRTALPKPKPTPIPSEAIDGALSLVGDPSLLARLVQVAASADLQQDLQTRIEQMHSHPSNWYANYDQIESAVREAIDHVFINFARAIAAYERGIIAIDSPFDRFVARWKGGKPPESAFGKGFGPDEFKGLNVFAGKGQCHLCHFGPNFTDQNFHNIGLPPMGPSTLENFANQMGRSLGIWALRNDPFRCLDPDKESCQIQSYLNPGHIELVGAFKTPSLRNVEQTAPYMHDGRFQSLEEVINHYRSKGTRPALGHREETLERVEFSAQEAKHLIAFLKALTAPIVDLTTPSAMHERIGQDVSQHSDQKKS